MPHDPRRALLKLCILLASDVATVLAGVASVRTASFILKLRASVAQINDEAPLLAPTEGIGVRCSPKSRVFRNGGKFEEQRRREGLHRYRQAECVGDTSDALALLSNDPLVELAIEVPSIALGSINGSSHPNYPNDPLFNLQESLHSAGLAADAFDLTAAWNLTTGSASVVVGIADTGIFLDHPDLRANRWRNLGEANCTTDPSLDLAARYEMCCSNGIDDDSNGYVDDCFGYNFADDTGRELLGSSSHGTMIAGIVAADTHNGLGVAGVAGGRPTAPGAALMTLTCFGRDGNGEAHGLSEAIVYAAENGAAISQNS